MLWCETSTPDLDEAAQFAEAVHAQFPGKLLAYNCSPSFNWRKHLDDETIASFQRELAEMGYKFQFVTLAGFHAVCNSMFELARGYAAEGMSAYVRLQQDEFANEEHGYTATRHQREVGAGYFDAVLEAVTGGESSTLALKGSTEEAQFEATPRVTTTADVVVSAPDEAGVLTPEALDLVVALQREFRGRREELLLARAERQERIEDRRAARLPRVDARRSARATGASRRFPTDLQDRRVEITGPAGDRKMVINAFNSGARIYMADFEDANSPTWENVVGGQQNLTDAIERTISLEQGEKSYSLNDEVAVLLVRPRGWHLQERHVVVDGEHVSGRAVRLRRLPRAQRRAAARARVGAVLLPPEAREPSRGAALERRLLLRPGPARDPARDDQGDRPHRDDPRGVRDGGDPLRAPRPLGRGSTRAAGTTSSR